jgi:hypothetical protein
LAGSATEPFFNRHAQGPNEKDMIRSAKPTAGKLADGGLAEMVLFRWGWPLRLRIVNVME